MLAYVCERNRCYKFLCFVAGDYTEVQLVYAKEAGAEAHRKMTRGEYIQPMLENQVVSVFLSECAVALR